ncbi:hypothetical protein GCM10027341_28840 [Spirosoma knui]
MLFNYAFVQAQTPTMGWVDGYIVINQNDTLRGQLFNRGTESTPTNFRFRPMSTATYQDYPVDAIKAVYLQPSDERFIRQTVRIDQTPYKVGKIQNGPDPMWGTETLLLRELVSDSVSLFHHHDKMARDHYWVKVADADLEELVLITYYDAEDKIKTQHRFRQQLFILAQACPSLQKQTPYLPFQLSAIQQFVLSLNGCQGNRPHAKRSVATTSARKIRFDWGIQAGATKTDIRFEPDLSTGYGPGVNSFPLTSSPQISGGLWGNLFLPTNRQQWSVYGVLSYQKYQAISNQRNISSNATYIKLLTAFRWQQPGDLRWKGYIFLGITNGLAIQMSNTYRSVGDRAYEQAVVGGVGLQHKRSFIELRHERGNGTVSFDNNFMATRTTGVFLGYTL